MGKVLSMPVRGEIRLDEAEKPMLDELDEARACYMRRRDKLIAQLDAPLREKIERILEEREEVAVLEKEDAYVRGTRMGAKMAVALLKGE